MAFANGRVVALALTCLAGLSGCMGNGYPAAEWTDHCAVQQSTDGSHPARTILEDALKQDRGAGMVAAVVVDGEVVWQDAVGVADDESPLTTAARMRIGSISKVFTAVLAARLADAGMLDVDAPIGRYLPDLSSQYAGVTVRQIVSHTSGIRQYDFGSSADSGNRLHFETLADAFARHETESLVASPGERRLYSSIAVNLLGVVIERITGASYAEALERWVTAPHGASDTLTDDASRFTACRPGFHSVYLGKIRGRTLWRDNSDLYPSGGLLSSASDLALFADRVLAAREGAGESMAPVDELGDVFGWDVRRLEDGEVDWIGHGGRINGAYASLRHYPRHGMTVAAISNYDLVLTRRRAAFFEAVRVQIPSHFSSESEAAFSD